MLSHSGRAGKHLTFKKLSQEVQTLKSKKSFAMVFWSLIFCRVSFNNKKTPNFPLWKQRSVLTQMSWKVLRTHILTARGHRVMMKVAVLTPRSTRTGRSKQVALAKTHQRHLLWKSTNWTAGPAVWAARRARFPELTRSSDHGASRARAPKGTFSGSLRRSQEHREVVLLQNLVSSRLALVSNFLFLMSEI